MKEDRKETKERETVSPPLFFVPYSSFIQLSAASFHLHFCFFLIFFSFFILPLHTSYSCFLLFLPFPHTLHSRFPPLLILFPHTHIVFLILFLQSCFPYSLHLLFSSSSFFKPFIFIFLLFFFISFYPSSLFTPLTFTFLLLFFISFSFVVLNASHSCILLPLPSLVLRSSHLSFLYSSLSSSSYSLSSTPLTLVFLLLFFPFLAAPHTSPSRRLSLRRTRGLARTGTRATFWLW